MYLLYDRVARMFTLETDEFVEFLGSITHAQAKLRNYGFTPSQAREAALSAIFNSGAPVDLDYIRKVAKQSLFFQENTNFGTTS